MQNTNTTPAFISSPQTPHMDDPFGVFNLQNDHLITTEMYDQLLYCSLINRCFHVTLEFLRRELDVNYVPHSPTTPLSPLESDCIGENLFEWLLIINEAGQVEWEALLDDDDDDVSSYSGEDSMWQQSSLIPSIDNGLNGQMVEELTLDEIFGGMDNQGLASVVEACQSSEVVYNECCVEVKEDDTQDFFITNDRITLSSLVNGKKNEEGDFYSQDAYLYDSSSFDLGNEDVGVISAFNFSEFHEAPYSNDIQGVSVGGNLVLHTMPHPERLMSSTPANNEDAVSLGPHSLAQTVSRTTEIASKEHGYGRVYVHGGNNSYSETCFPLYMRNFPEYPSFCSKNEEGASCSQDANIHGSFLNGKGNEDNNMISFRNLYDNHESAGMIIGGKLVPEIMTNIENPIMYSPPPNLDVTGTEGLDSVVQAILRSVESSTNESVRKRKRFEESGDGEGDCSTRNAHLYGSYCGKGNEDDGVSLCGGSHQNYAYPA